MNIVAKSLANANPPQVFLDGSRRSRVVLHTVAIGIGTYEPGWRWSLHAGPMTGKPSAHHVGYVVSGRMMVEDVDGQRVALSAGDAFELAPGADAWVLGDTPCVAMDFAPLAKG